MIQYNIGKLDNELGPFTEEMKQKNDAGFEEEFAVDGVPGMAGEGMDPLTMEFAMGADFDMVGLYKLKSVESHSLEKAPGFSTLQPMK
jgi:hypothetical protein